MSTPYDLDIFVSAEGPDHLQDSGDGHQDIGHRVTTFPCLYYTTPRPPCQPWGSDWVRFKTRSIQPEGEDYKKIIAQNPTLSTVKEP